jgi:aspartate kinase
MKFGGTSVGDPARIANACDIVAARTKTERPVVVVSAASKVTDMLLKAVEAARQAKVDIRPIAERVNGLVTAFGLDTALIADELTLLQQTLYAIFQDGAVTPEEADLIASFGERISARTFAAVLNARGVPAVAYDAFDVGMVTDDTFGAAEPLPESEEALRAALAGDTGPVPVVTGFIGKTRDGRITTLGRGGSDYSAAIIGAALRAAEIEIWTDVDGVMSADPRVVPEARTIPALSFSEAAELAYFGAKVLHPKTILPAVKRAIPVRVLNTFRPDNPGTVITAEGAEDPARSGAGAGAGAAPRAHPVQAIAAKKGITVVHLVSSRMLLAHGFLAKIFDVFARRQVVVDLVATSEVSVSLTVDRDERLESALGELRSFAEVGTLTGRALVAVVGRGIGDAVGLGGRVLSVLGDNGINIELVSAGLARVNFSVVIEEKDCDTAVRALHAALFGEKSGGSNAAVAR